MSAIIEVKWNGKKFPVEFQSVKELETTTVKHLKAYIQRMTGINANSIRLQAFGALMNNDDMPLSIYGLRPGSFITMKVNNNPYRQHENSDPKPQQQDIPPALPNRNRTQPQTQPQTQNHHHKQQHHHHKQHHHQQHKEEGHSPAVNSEDNELVEKLQVIEDKVNKEVIPQVKKYEKDVKEFLVKHEKTEKDKKKQVYMGAYLGEQLMHVLFDLDAFTCGPNNLNARQKRKEVVKIAQALLDKVDEIKSVVKNVAVVDEHQII